MDTVNCTADAAADATTLGTAAAAAVTTATAVCHSNASGVVPHEGGDASRRVQVAVDEQALVKVR